MIYWFSITRHWRQWANGQPLDISAEPLALWQYHWRNEDAITWSALDISIVVGQRCESWAGTFKPAGIVRWFKQISNTGSIFIALISEMVEVKCWFRWEFFIWLCSLVFFLPLFFTNPFIQNLNYTYFIYIAHFGSQLLQCQAGTSGPLHFLTLLNKLPFLYAITEVMWMGIHQLDNRVVALC